MSSKKRSSQKSIAEFKKSKLDAKELTEVKGGECCQKPTCPKLPC